MEIEEAAIRLSAIENVIERLPVDYLELGWFLRLSGARLQSALKITSRDVVAAFKDGYTATQHTNFLVNLMGGALTPNAVDYMLEYIITIRKMYLNRCGIADDKSPTRIFIDHTGKPLQSKNVMAAFREANAKAGQQQFIGPSQVRKTVVAAYTDARLSRHAQAIVVLGYLEANSPAVKKV